MKKGDFYFGAALLALCCFMFCETFHFYFPKGQSDNPALWPRILLIILALLSIALMVQAVRAKKRKAPTAAADKAANTKEPLTWEKVKTFFSKPGDGKVLLAVLSIVAFIFLFQYLGFVIAVPLFFMALSCVMESPSGWKDFLIRLIQALLLTALVYLVFYRLLRVKLPLGFLPKKWFY